MKGVELSNAVSWTDTEAEKRERVVPDVLKETVARHRDELCGEVVGERK